MSTAAESVQAGPVSTKIAYVTLDDSTRPSAALGGYYLGEALRALGDVCTIGSLSRLGWHDWLYGARKLLLRRLLHTEMPLFCEPTVAKHYARQVNDRVKETGCSVLVTNQPFLAAYLSDSIPVILHTDSTVAALRRAGWYTRGWSERSIRNWEQLDRTAVLRSEAVFYTSQWAADSALNDYGACASRCHAIPIGANIDDPVVQLSTIERPPDSVCTLLFYGGGWERKGGDIAYQAIKALKRHGVTARLIICGPKVLPVECQGDEMVRFVPPIAKDRPGEQARFAALCSEADFLILPTRSDCTPVAVPEANAFGVPAIVSNVGGMESVVFNGENGWLLPAGSSPEQYAACIAENFKDTQRYVTLRKASRAVYTGRLNWTVAVRQMADVLREHRLFDR